MGFPFVRFAAYNDPLGECLRRRRLASSGTLPPFFRLEGYFLVGLLDLPFAGPSRRSVLAVTHRLCLDVQGVDVSDKRNTAENGEHPSGNENQFCDLRQLLSLLYAEKKTLSSGYQ